MVIAALLLLPPAALTARAQSPTGEVRGVVVDHEGAPLQGAAIVVTSTETNAERETTTDAGGRFSVPGLPIGSYEVTASQAGLAARRQEALRLRIGETVSLRLELRPALIADTLTVGGVLPPFEPSRSAVSSNIDAEVIANLPSSARDALDLALLTPGPVYDTRTGSYSFNGQPSTLNTVVVDGTEGRMPVSWLPFHYSQETVAGVIVNTNSYAAEYGRSAGGVIGVATKSGSNRFSGSVFDYFRNDQFGGTAGGPLVTNRHFFFGGYEGQRFEDTLSTGDVRTRDHDTFLIRTDHAFDAGVRASLRYNDHDAEVNTLDAGARSFTGTLATLFGANLLNEARVQRARHRDPVPFTWTIDRTQFADTLALVAGAHTVKLGIDVLRDDIPGGSAHDLTLFAQDDWRVTPTATVSAGLRMDRQTFPDGFPGDEDTSNVAPRLGLAWSPVNARFVVRGGYGLFYARQPAGYMGRGEAPRTHQASAGIDYDWMRHTSAGVSYLFADGEWAATTSRYHGLTLDLHRRFAQGYYYRFAYTLGKVEDDGLAGLTDTRHRFAATGIYDTDAFADRFGGVIEDILKDWTLSAVWALQSGQPETSIEGVRTGRWLSRRVSLDPRIARHFSLGGTRDLALMWEAFNLMGNEDFLTSGVAEGRVTQLAARFSF